MSRALKTLGGAHKVLGSDDTLLSADAELEVRIEDELAEIRSDVREIRIELERRTPGSERISKRLAVAERRSDRAHDSVRCMQRK